MKDTRGSGTKALIAFIYQLNNIKTKTLPKPKVQAWFRSEWIVVKVVYIHTF